MKAARRHLRLTQKSAGAIVGISQAAWQVAETTGEGVGWLKLMEFSDKTGISYKWLEKGEGEMLPEATPKKQAETSKEELQQKLINILEQENKRLRDENAKQLDHIIKELKQGTQQQQLQAELEEIKQLLQEINKKILKY